MPQEAGFRYAVQAAGNRGKVIGVDISYVEEIHGTEILRADILQNDGIHEEIANAAGRKVNAIVMRSLTASNRQLVQ